MRLRSPTEHEKGVHPSKPPPMLDGGFWPSAASVMPAWIAGIQVRRMRPEDSHVNLGSGRIVAWMERSGIQEGGMGHGKGNGVRE